MKARAELSAEKLRGGFYTPLPLVEHCLDRVAELVGSRSGLRLLEPSVGDGAFVAGLREHAALAERVDWIQAIELDPAAAAVAREAVGRDGAVLAGSAIGWASRTDERFDVAVGNPPFVRYQLIPPADRLLLSGLAEQIGVRVYGVANLWIWVLLAALSRLREGAAFAFVVPAESLTGTSAGVIRAWLLERAAATRFDCLAPGSFPGVLQEVIVLSGRVTAAGNGSPEITISERTGGGSLDLWSHRVDPAEATWTRYLLRPRSLDALDAARAAPTVRALGQVARLEVSVVTGANGYFCVDERTAEEFDLGRWLVPLLARVRSAPGLRFGVLDRAGARMSGAPCWLLDFGPERPDPLEHPGARQYLQRGRRLGIPARYKCRVREPWYRVPGIRAGDLLLSKRSHRFPRLLVNDVDALTTDTIYRGWMRPDSDLCDADLSAAFHGSLTLLSAELEGRSFGGGVLELVPSEVGRLAIAVQPGLGGEHRRLDQLARRDEPDALIEQTDELLVRSGALDEELIVPLREAREALCARRLARARHAGTARQPSAETVAQAA